MLISFRADRSWANRVDPDQQSDQGLHCLPFRQHRLDALIYGRVTLFISSPEPKAHK